MSQDEISHPDAMRAAIALMARLRGPEGCPWDREQTFDTIMRHTLEETYEVFDAIERRAWPDLKDELGDLLLQVLFYSQLASEAGYFTIDDVARNLGAKLIRRHPHVFGNASVSNSKEVKLQWDEIKGEEKRQAGKRDADSIVASVSRHTPAMMEAQELGKRAAKVGFDWPDTQGIFRKLEEEICELKVEVQVGTGESIADELGDVLFTVVNLARHLKVDAEFALRGTNAKFRRRFRAMETSAGETGGLEKCSAQELEALWDKAKDAE